MDRKHQDTGVICFCGQDWWYHNRAHSDFQLMIRTADRQRVLLVNSIGMRMPMPGKSAKFLTKIVRKLRSMAKFLRRPLPERRDLFVMTPISVPVFGVPVLKHLAAFFVRAQVAVVARLLGIKKPLIVVTPPTAWEVVRPMRRRGLVYNRSDKHSAFKEANTALIEHLERELMQNADHVIYASRELMRQETDLCPGNARFVDHGIDENWLDQQPVDEGGDEAEELGAIPHPRIGFFGGLRGHLVDLPLLTRIADTLPDCQVVLIGDAASGIENLLERDNVHWFGRRDHADIPSFGAGFDVALMPYLQNDWIHHCNPIKLKEYLALGLPVVSSDFPEAHRYADHVHIATDADQFVAMVGELASRRSTAAEREQRRKAVRDMTWAHQAEVLRQITSGETDREATTESRSERESQASSNAGVS